VSVREVLAFVLLGAKFDDRPCRRIMVGFAVTISVRSTDHRTSDVHRDLVLFFRGQPTRRNMLVLPTKTLWVKPIS
jgi:hypothetical protein